MCRPAPPPPLQEGATVTALQLLPQPAAAPQIEQLAASIEALKETGQQNIQLPLPPQQLQELLTTPNTQNFLKQLPPELLRNIAVYFAESGTVQKQEPADNNPDTLRHLLSAYLPQKSPGASTPPPEAEQPDIFDDNLLHIMQAQLQAKATQQNIQSPPAPGNTKQAAFSPLTTTLDALISSSEETSQKTSGFSALLRQLIPQNAPQESSPAPQNMFQLHILKILPPETTPEQINAFMQKMPASAQIAEAETATSTGQPILQTADAHFVVSTPATVPTGSKIIFTATPMTPEEIVQTGLFTTQESGSPQNGAWPALQQALQTLQPAGPQAAAAQSLRNTLPTPTPQLAPAALFFLAALRSGSIENWLGANTLQALQQTGKKGLAAMLSPAISTSLPRSQKMFCPATGARSPFRCAMTSRSARCSFMCASSMIRSEQEKGQGGNGKPATRFILNLALSRMGAVQLDGFIQKKNFDIILRTEDKLPFDMRQELMKRFAQGLDQVQMQGGISFQTRQQGWMVPEAGNLKAEA